MTIRRVGLRSSRLTFMAFILSMAGATLARGGFASTETFLPAVGRVPGQGGAQFYTTVWATNLTTAQQSFTFQLLKQGQANGSPASFTDNLAPGETKVYENVVESKLGLTNAIGAGRITSSGEIFVSERIYNQAPGDDVGNTEGLFFAGVPKGFSISAGQSASIQGINQSSSENFRYNFALIETGGGSPTVNVQVFDGSGTLLGQKAYILQPYEQVQPNVGDVVSGIATTNARITATVTGGTGSALLAGAQLANESQDSSGFEMTFRDDLLGGGGTAGVTSLNGLSGALTLTPGNGISITPSGTSIAIAYTGGAGGSGLASVTHDTSLAGSGTSGDPLGVAIPLSLSGNSSIPMIDVHNDGGSGIYGRHGTASPFLFNGTEGVVGDSASGNGVRGMSSTDVGVFGISNQGLGVEGLSTSNAGVYGASSFIGVLGSSTSHGVVGQAGVSGYNATSAAGVWGDSQSGAGLIGTSASNTGVYGHSNSNQAIQGVSDTNSGVYGLTVAASGLSGTAGVWGDASGYTGVYGTATTGYGVLGKCNGTGIGVYGYNLTAGYGGYIDGDFGVNGNTFVIGAGHMKNFIEPHPKDASKEIRFVSLEGPESGTYFRGSSHIVGGFARIPVPESFGAVTAPAGMTVLLSPVGSPAVLTVIRKGLDTIEIQGSSDVEFDYMVNGIRKGFESYQAVAENVHFVPRSATDEEFPVRMNELTRKVLRANGVLNADDTINLETAQRLGWDRQKSWNSMEGKK